jgi:transcriptional regulator with XRE-family HTH domain
MNRSASAPQKHIAVDFRTRLGAAIQKYRRQRGMSQRQLAKAAKLSLKYVGEIERGQANFTIDAIERLLEALKRSPVSDESLGLLLNDRVNVTAPIRRRGRGRSLWRWLISLPWTRPFSGLRRRRF